MRGVGREPDIFWIRVRHHGTHVMLPFHRSPDMGVRSQPYSKGDRLPADLIQRVSQPLELIVAGPTFRPAAHIGLPMVAATGRKKIVREVHHVRDELGITLRIDPRIGWGDRWRSKLAWALARAANLQRRSIGFPPHRTFA